MSNDQYFKRPNRPEGYQRRKVIIRGNDTFFTLMFFFNIVSKQSMTMLMIVRLLAFEFFGWLIGNMLCGPNLTVRMRVGTPHEHAFILKNLHILNKFFRTQFSSLLYPGSKN